MNKMKTFFSKNKNEIIFYLLVFLFIALLFSIFPYSHDDWAWGSSEGIDRLESHFNNYNGRWAGNILVIILTRSHFLRILFSSLVMLVIIIYMSKMVNSKDSFVKYFTLLFIAALPRNLLMQSVSWISGFVNYVVPTMLILLYLYFNKDLIHGTYTKKKKIYAPFLLILGSISTLFVEHLTIYCVLVSLFFNIFIYIKYKKIDINNLLYLIGSILGSVLMFSNGAYRAIANNEDLYRNMTPTISSYIQNFIVICKEVVINSHIINILISLVFIALLYDFKPQKSFLKFIKVSLVMVFASFPFYTILVRIMNLSLIFKYIKYFSTLFACIYVLAIIISLFVIFKKQKLFQYLFICFSIVIMCAPLIVVDPIGSRCFFSQYVLYAIFVTMLICDLINKYKFSINVKKYIKYIIIAISFAFFFFYLSIYLNIFRIYIKRQRYLEEHINDDVIVLPIISSDGFIWNLNPKSELFNERYKKFYNIDEDNEIKLVPYKKWEEMVGE